LKDISKTTFITATVAHKLTLYFNNVPCLLTWQLPWQFNDHWL